MNIEEAKKEIYYTLCAYHQKDREGNYVFPMARQRPIVLMGPPGVGKTAIVEQVAKECEVGFVTYALTHHTRQSAVGLPRLQLRNYGSQEITVTEYTMSEIVAAVYECMERTGKHEGILFLDEINCVSETLAPTMLQLLQNKTFGTHRLPQGWLLVAAGNPPEYNRSAREFDVVTLDRVRLIPIEADYPTWARYAWKQCVHGAVQSYLSIHPDHFYSMEEKENGQSFVTGRGWEDLSELLKQYEKIGAPISQKQVEQYLHKESISRAFTTYYLLYRKYGEDYGIVEILQETISQEAYGRKVAMAQKGNFEERFTLVHLLLAGLNSEFQQYYSQRETVMGLYQGLQTLKLNWQQNPLEDTFEDYIKSRYHSLQVKADAHLLQAEEQKREKAILNHMEAYALQLKQEHIKGLEAGMKKIQELFSYETESLERCAQTIQEQLKAAFQFMLNCFSDGQEMVLFVSELARNERAMEFLSEYPCEVFLRYSQMLLYEERERELQAKCREIIFPEVGESEREIL